MTASRNTAADTRTVMEPPASPASAARASAGRRNRRLGVAVLGIAALAAMSALAAAGAFNGNAAPLTNCAANPSSCGYPDATNTGVRSRVTSRMNPTTAGPPAAMR